MFWIMEHSSRCPYENYLHVSVNYRLKLYQLYNVADTRVKTILVTILELYHPDQENWLLQFTGYTFSHAWSIMLISQIREDILGKVSKRKMNWWKKLKKFSVYAIYFGTNIHSTFKFFIENFIPDFHMRQVLLHSRHIL